MPRGRRAATAPVEEPVAAADEIETVEAIDDDIDELDAIELTEADLYEDTAPVEDEDDDSSPEAEKVAEPTIAETGSVYVTYKGLKEPGRDPQVIGVTIPEDGTQADDPDAFITDGTSYNLKLGVKHAMTEEQAQWLSRHPLYNIEKA